MSQARFGRTDPDRLAVFAVRALLSVLDERDWVTVIRLNGPKDGETPPPLAPLDKAHQDRLTRALDLKGKLAEYSGETTPCRSALEATRDLLDETDRSDVSQVVIFLSDGKCTGPGNQEQVMGFLDGLRSHQDASRRFQFYLLRFQGTEPSAGLGRLADVTGGEAIEVRRGDPTRILNTFAQALSRSQGYESQILTPSHPELPAHRGARRVRLLAVVRGGGSDPLSITVANRQGNPLIVNPLGRGDHRFLPDGQEYRFASAEYRPSGEPIRVTVRGAGNDWEVVALPEYRLMVEMKLHRGQCGDEGEVLSVDTVAAGSGVCAVLRLINDRNQVVGQDVTAGQLKGVVELTLAGSDKPQVITATPRTATTAAFQLDLQALTAGYHTLRAAVHLTPPGESRPRILRVADRTLQAIDRAINAEPPEMSFGGIYPGFRDIRQLQLKGNFPDTEARLEIAEGESIPQCVTLRFADKPLGEAVRMRSNQTYPLELRVAEECADEEVAWTNTQLLVRMPEIPEVGKISIPLEWRLDASVLTSDPLVLELEAGATSSGRVSDTAAITYEAHLEPPKTRDGGRAHKLRLGYFDEQSDQLLDAKGEPVRKRQFTLTKDRPLNLWVEARSCCDTGEYRSQLRLRPVDGGPARLVPLIVSVKGSWWSCYRSWVIAGLLGLLAALLTFYILSMFTHSRFLPREQLITRLVPLRWPRYGGAPRPASDRGGDREEVTDMIQVGLPWHQRVLNWLRANPLVFGLPGKRYYETVELLLAPDLGLSSVTLIPERDVVGRLQKATDIDPWEEGRLFARAGNSVSFQAIRGSKKEIGQLTPEGWYGKIEGLSVDQLSKGQRLIYKIPTKERKEGSVAGWQLE